MKLRTCISMALLVLIGAIGVVFSVLESNSYYEWQQKRMVKRVLAANPEQLVSAGHQVLATRRGYVGEISRSSEIPSILRKLKPGRVLLTTNFVCLTFSDIANPFELYIFAPDADPSESLGYGSHKWIEGLWLFDDGQLEKFGQPDA